MIALSPNREVDRLIEAAWNCRNTIDWAIDALAGGDEIDTDDVVELGRISDTSPPLYTALRVFTRYSDGRPIRSLVPVVDGLVYDVTWPADPDWQQVEYALAAEMTWDGDWRLVLEGRLPVDPGVPDRGGYRVWANDRVCAVRIDELPPAPRLEIVR